MVRFRLESTSVNRSGRCRADVRSMWGRFGPDAGSVSGRCWVSVRSALGHYRVDVGSLLGRCRVGVGLVSGRCQIVVGAKLVVGFRISLGSVSGRPMSAGSACFPNTEPTNPDHRPRPWSLIKDNRISARLCAVPLTRPAKHCRGRARPASGQSGQGRLGAAPPGGAQTTAEQTWMTGFAGSG